MWAGGGQGERGRGPPSPILVAVPAGTKHNFRNTGAIPLVLYTVYAPPEHAPDAVHATKEDAEAAEAAGEDRPPSS